MTDKSKLPIHRVDELEQQLDSKLNYNQITNCLLENPKLVDLELSPEGVLTFKAGSIVVIPYGTSAPTMNIGDSLNGGIITDISWDGSKLFYYVRYENDKTITTPVSGDRFILMGYNNALSFHAPSLCFSGTSESFVSFGQIYYRTDLNLMFLSTNNGQVWTQQYMSFPFALVNTDGTKMSAISHQFNSLGFMGSELWCSKGVKYITPNGRNDDGTLNNIVQTTTKFSTVSTLNRNDTYISIRNGIVVYSSEIDLGQAYYNNDENIIYNLDMPIDMAWVGKFNVINDKIQKFEVDLPFQAVNNKDFKDFKQEYNDNALKTNQITNCLLENPRLIDYTLSNGVFTLKAGSQVIIPNGANNFEYYTITSDLSIKAEMFATSSSRFLVYVKSNNTITVLDTMKKYITSGASTPTTFDSGGKAYWYDTTNNIIKRTGDRGVTWTPDEYSLPFALVSITSGTGITSIDQVFQSIGYIGSTIWVGKGVKCLDPNGFNENGTLYSDLINLKNVKVHTRTGTSTSKLYIFMNHANGGYVEATTNPLSYNSEYNKLNNIDSLASVAVIGTGQYNGSQYTSVSFKQPFHAVDYNDFKLADEQNVKISGEQTLTSHLNIKNNYITQFSTDIDTMVNPASNQYVGLQFNDKNNKELGYVRAMKSPSGNANVWLEVINFDTDGTKRTAYSGIALARTGYTEFHLPTPLNNSNANIGATTKWIRNHTFAPSSKYIDLTLQTSGSIYTAPADGYYTITKISSGVGQWMTFNEEDATTPDEKSWTGSGVWQGDFGVHLHMPVKKGERFKIFYSLGRETKTFRFYYAEIDSY